MEKIVVASGNKNKLREIAEIFKGYEVVSMQDAGFSEEIEENGKTFEENALIKARAVCNALHLPALADDSGLCVAALGGAPGVYSARYAGVHGDDGANNALLLKNLEDVPEEDRGASRLFFRTGRKLPLREGLTGTSCLRKKGKTVSGTIRFFTATSCKRGSASHPPKRKTPFRTGQRRLPRFPKK